MKRLSLLGMMSLIIFFTFYFLVLGNKQLGQAETNSAAENVSSSKKLFLGPRVQVARVRDSLKAPSPCDDLANDLDYVDFNLPSEDWIDSLNEENVDQCQDEDLKSRLESLKNVCFKVVNEQSCLVEAIFLRSLLRTRNIEDTEDRYQLADLVLKEFANGQPDFGKLMKFSEKLMDLSPDQLAFHKLWAMSKVVYALDQKVSPSEYADEIERKIDPRIWEDPEAWGLDIALKTGFKPASVEELTRDLLATKSDSRLHEILGWSLWKQNKRAEAMNQLKRAMELNPNDPWLQEQYKKINNGNAGENDYQARFSLGFDFRELFE